MALYGMTTSDDWWTDRQRAAALDSRLANEQMKTASLASQGYDPNTRGTGFRATRGNLQEGSHELAALARAAIPSAEMGKPSSFRGGAGGAEPIEVVRGMTRTYAQPGASTTGGFVPEYTTALKARQADVARQRAEAVRPPSDMESMHGATAMTEEEATKIFGQYEEPTKAGEPPELAGLRKKQAELYDMQIEEAKQKLQTKKETDNVNAFTKGILASPTHAPGGKIKPGLGTLHNAASDMARSNPDHAREFFNDTAARMTRALAKENPVEELYKIALSIDKTGTWGHQIVGDFWKENRPYFSNPYTGLTKEQYKPTMPEEINWFGGERRPEDMWP